jgi:hypothetical protein
VNELRAPDPTLDALAAEDELSVVLLTGSEDPATAHAYPVPRCGEGEGQCAIARDARRFAVPCRACFPDAPEPGTDPQNRPKAGMYLSWQVTP